VLRKFLSLLCVVVLLCAACAKHKAALPSPMSAEYRVVLQDQDKLERYSRVSEAGVTLGLRGIAGGSVLAASRAM
jgi:hypothetical protein